MQIDLGAADPRDFFVRPADLPGIGPVVQISPRGQKHRWRADELHLRSLLCTPDGTVLSSGFPKFFNLGEHPEHDEAARAAVAAGAAWLTEKMDGSLLIRDVLGGRVHLRTRGSATLPPDKAPRIAALLDAHPAVCDPSVMPDRSLLFEFTSPHPDDRIIVPYDRPALTALGWMSRDGRLPSFHGTPEAVAALAAQTGTAPVRFLPVPATLDALIAQVRAWTEREGVVLRYRGGLLKLKSLRYLRNHTARFHLTRQRLWRFCWAAQVRDRDHLAAALHERGLDWEIVDSFSADFARYADRRDTVVAQVDGFLAALDAAGASRASDRRAAVSLLRGVLAERDAWKPLFGLGIAALDGDTGARDVAVVSLIFGESMGAARHFLRDGREAALDVTPGLSR